jgi:hypothetical protein
VLRSGVATWIGRALLESVTYLEYGKIPLVLYTPCSHAPNLRTVQLLNPRAVGDANEETSVDDLDALLAEVVHGGSKARWHSEQPTSSYTNVTTLCDDLVECVVDAISNLSSWKCTQRARAAQVCRSWYQIFQP